MFKLLFQGHRYRLHPFDRQRGDQQHQGQPRGQIGVEGEAGAGGKGPERLRGRAAIFLPPFSLCPLPWKPPG